MYQIKTFNAIAPEGLQRLNKENMPSMKVMSQKESCCEAKSCMTILFQKVY